MFTIVTGRYNNETWEASVRYREKHKFLEKEPPNPLTTFV